MSLRLTLPDEQWIFTPSDPNLALAEAITEIIGADNWPDPAAPDIGINFYRADDGYDPGVYIGSDRLPRKCSLIHEAWIGPLGMRVVCVRVEKRPLGEDRTLDPRPESR